MERIFQGKSEDPRPPASGPACAVSVVIVSWNVRDLLLRCIDSVYRTTAASDYEVIVVDNASSDGTVETVKTRFPAVRLIDSPENLGFPKACNLGARNSRGKYIFFLNPDTELKEKALDKLCSFLENNGEAAAAGAKLLWPDGTYQDSYRRFFGVLFSILEVFEFHYYFPKNRAYLHSLYDLEVFKEPAEVDWVVGAAFAVRRDVFERIGGFDGKIFMYAEDTDLCRRIAGAGGKIYFFPRAEVIHYKAGSSRLSNVRSVDYYKSLYYYHLKHSGSLKAFFLLAALALWSAFYVLILLLKLLFIRDREGCRIKIMNKLSLLKWILLS